MFNYYIKRPKVSIELIHHGSQSRPKGYRVYVPVLDEENVYDARESKQEFELTWRITLKLRNLSSKDALYPKIYFHNDGPKLIIIPTLNSNEPILSKAQKDLEAKYTLYEIKRGQDRSELSILRNNIFKNLKILLEYSDEIGVKHYSTWENNICKHVIIKPSRYGNQDFFRLPDGICKK